MVDSTNTMGLPFVVGIGQKGRGKPIMLWENNAERYNLQFVKGIDPEHFSILASDALRGVEDEENGNRRAISIRSIYFHSMETLFSLLFSYLQAPYCMFGWIQEYQTSDLRELVRAVSEGKPFPSCVHNKAPTWQNVSELLWCRAEFNSTNQHEVVATNYATFMAKIADEFLETGSSGEYNGIKHGLRISSGSFSFKFEPQNKDGTSTGQVHEFNGGKHGVGFFVLHKIDGAPKFHRTIETHAVNFDPKRIVTRIEFISHLIRALRSHILLSKPEFSSETFTFSDDGFDDVWDAGSNAKNISYKVNIRPAQVCHIDIEEVFEIYEKTDSDKQTNPEDE